MAPLCQLHVVISCSAPAVSCTAQLSAAPRSPTFRVNGSCSCCFFALPTCCLLEYLLCYLRLQATLSAAQPGWADPILAAVTQLLDSHELDLQLLAAVLLRLEDLAVGQQVHAAREVLLLQQQQGFGSRQASSNGNTPGDAAGDAAVAAVQQASMLPEVEAAMQVTLQQLAGNLSAQQQQRPGPQGSAGSVVYVMAAEVQGSWKALKTLCWCDDELARRVGRHWLQQLLALTLRQSLKVGPKADEIRTRSSRFEMLVCVHMCWKFLGDDMLQISG